MTTRITLLFTTIFYLALLIGCRVDPIPPEPLYDNPYDPRSPNFNDELDVGTWTLLQKNEHPNMLIPEAFLNHNTCYLLGGINATNAVLNSAYSFFLPDSADTDSIHLYAEQPMLFARKHFSAISLKGVIYAFGGDTSGTVEAYNLLEHRWFGLGNLPSNRMQFGTAVIQFHDSILVVGGKSISGLASNEAWLYKPSVNLWSLFVTLPVHIVSPTLQIFNDNLYLIGGFDSAGRASSQIHVLDLRNKSWSLFPDTLKTPRGNCASLLRNGRIYVFGGQNEFGAFVTKTDEIKLVAGKCVSKQDIPYQVLPYGCFYHHNQMKLVCGGRDQPLMVLRFELVY